MSSTATVAEVVDSWQNRLFTLLKEPEQNIFIRYSTYDAARRAHEAMYQFMRHTIKHNMIVEVKIGLIRLVNGTRIIFTTQEIIDRNKSDRGLENVHYL